MTDSLQPPKAVRRLISEAFDEAKTVKPVANARIYCIIADGHFPLGAGSNSIKTHPFQKKYSKNEHCIHLHAEINAIVNATDLGDLSGATMVVARAKIAKPRGPFVWGMAKPCEGCQRAIAAFGIKHVYYTTDTEGVIECL